MEIVLKGLIIGLSVSVPLGPIGMLCIQRTLNRGRKFGLITGLGATTSDIIYAIITMFFLNFVIGIVEQYQTIIQLVGSVVIALFGVWIYRSNPVVQPLLQDKPDNNFLSDYISSLLLTLSNPLILFVMIALFSQLEFVTSETSIMMHLIGLISIVGGAFIWWFILTGFSSRFRNKLNFRGLKIVNRVVGSIIIVFGIIGIITLFYKVSIL